GGGRVLVGLELSRRRPVHRFSELRLGGKARPLCFRRGDDDETVVWRKPVARERVHFRERYRREKTPVERKLLPDRRQRFVFEEVARVFVGAAPARAARALLHD